MFNNNIIIIILTFILRLFHCKCSQAQSGANVYATGIQSRPSQKSEFSVFAEKIELFQLALCVLGACSIAWGRILRRPDPRKSHILFLGQQG